MRSSEDQLFLARGTLVGAHQPVLSCVQSTARLADLLKLEYRLNFLRPFCGLNQNEPETRNTRLLRLVESPIPRLAA